MRQLVKPVIDSKGTPTCDPVVQKLTKLVQPVEPVTAATGRATLSCCREESALRAITQSATNPRKVTTTIPATVRPSLYRRASSDMTCDCIWLPVTSYEADAPFGTGSARGELMSTEKWFADTRETPGRCAIARMETPNGISMRFINLVSVETTLHRRS